MGESRCWRRTLLICRVITTEMRQEYGPKQHLRGWASGWAHGTAAPPWRFSRQLRSISPLHRGKFGSGVGLCGMARGTADGGGRIAIFLGRDEQRVRWG